MEFTHACQLLASLPFLTWKVRHDPGAMFAGHVMEPKTAKQPPGSDIGAARIVRCIVYDPNDSKTAAFVRPTHGLRCGLGKVETLKEAA